MTRKQHNVPIAIIGAGPAGIAAAIQLWRSGREILVIASHVGGLIRNANLIENLIGYPAGISGPDYCQKITQQFESHHIPFLKEYVRSVTHEAEGYKITTDTTEVQAEIVVIGTGTLPKQLNIPGEAEAHIRIPKKFFYEIADVSPHIPDLHVDRVLIVGSGDVAYDYALHISPHAQEVIILQRTTRTSSLSLLQDRVHASSRITVRHPALLQQIEQNDTEIRVLVQSDKTTEWITGDLLLVAIGRAPNIGFLSPRLLDIYNTASPHPTLYFIGDVKNGNFRQVSIAMGDGVKAAMDIVKS